MTERERKFRELLKMMVAKDPKIFSDDFKEDPIEIALEEKGCDRVYFIALSIRQMVEKYSPLIPSGISDKEIIDSGFMDLFAAFGQFGLAILNKRKDPFARLEKADRILISAVKYFEAKKADTAAKE
jgi:hypothetical protein